MSSPTQELLLSTRSAPGRRCRAKLIAHRAGPERGRAQWTSPARAHPTKLIRRMRPSIPGGPALDYRPRASRRRLPGRLPAGSHWHRARPRLGQGPLRGHGMVSLRAAFPPGGILEPSPADLVARSTGCRAGPAPGMFAARSSAPWIRQRAHDGRQLRPQASHPVRHASPAPSRSCPSGCPWDLSPENFEGRSSPRRCTLPRKPRPLPERRYLRRLDPSNASSRRGSPDVLKRKATATRPRCCRPVLALLPPNRQGGALPTDVTAIDLRRRRRASPARGALHRREEERSPPIRSSRKHVSPGALAPIDLCAPIRSADVHENW